MAEPGTRVTIDGGILISGSDVTFRDLEITCTFKSRVTSIAGPWPQDLYLPTGFSVYSKNVKLINNIVHDGGEGIEGWVGAIDMEAYGNIVYYQGWKGPDRGHGHGFYLQNATGVKSITDNIAFSQFDMGIQAYGSSATQLNNIQLVGNVLFNNGDMAMNRTRNLLLGGTTMANNGVVRDNFSYTSTRDTTGAEVNLGYYLSGVGCSNMQFQGNYVVSSNIALSIHPQCAFSSFSGNTVWGQSRGQGLPSGNRQLGHNNRPSVAESFLRPNK
jgi:parallel beta-helix repeat protein